MNCYNEKTRRRMQSIVQCLNEGLNCKQIADELGISIRTVHRYVKFILENQEE